MDSPSNFRRLNNDNLLFKLRLRLDNIKAIGHTKFVTTIINVVFVAANTKADIKASVEVLKDKKNREYFQIKDIRIKLKVGDAAGKIISQNINKNNDALGMFYT